MASIEKRSSRNGFTSYRITVSCGYDSSGKKVRKSKTIELPVTMTDKQRDKELNRQAVDFENKVMNGNYSDTSNIKLSDFCAKYLEFADTILAPTTKVFYIKVIDNIIKPSLGHMRLKDIKPIHAQQFIQTLSGEGIRTDKKSNKLSPSTVKRYFTVLKSIMAKAYKLELIDRNPTETSKLDIPEVNEPDVEIFTKEETAHMLSCLDNEPLMFQIFIHLAIVTGCRRGELVALKWQNVDFSNNFITVKHSNYKLAGEDIKSKTPKTKSSIREIVIPTYLTELLKLYHIEQIKQKFMLGDKWANEEWIFTQWDGSAIHPCTPTKQFTKFLKRNNIPHRKFHSLRHTSATLLLSSGTNVKTVASRLGHTQLSTTNRYVHSLRDSDEAAAQMFEELASSQKKKKDQA